FTSSPTLNMFLVLNAVKLLFVHRLLDSYNVDMFIVILAIEYVVSVYLYFVATLATGSRLIFVASYLLQAIFIAVALNYNFIFASNIHINIISKLYWEFLAVGENALSTTTAAAAGIALLDVYFAVKLVRDFKNIRSVVFGDTGICVRQIIAGGVALVLAVTSVNAYEFLETGNSPDRYKEIEDYSLHHYGMFASSYLELYNFRNTKESVNKLKRWREGNSQQISGKRQQGGVPSVLLIQVESLDANIIGQKWHGKLITPYLSRIAKENVYFPYTLSYRSAGGTSDTEIAILNNVEPLSDTPTISIQSYDFPNSLPRVFRNNNFNVRAFHGNEGRYYNRDAAYSQMGYDIFYDQQRMMLPTEGWGASDARVFDFALQHLSSKRKPFFDYIITMSSHEPFTNVHNYYTTDRFNDVTPQRLKDYFVSISYTDRSLGLLVNSVREKYPNSYIFIFGDHTPYVLRNKSSYGIAMTDVDDRAMQFVPMIIITPDHKKKQESRYAASFLDIAPTIIRNNNINYTYQIQGDDLLGELKNTMIPYKGKQYPRDYLFRAAAGTRANSFGAN
ncbi:MAG: LTA synthase family protein, partial [Desulfuromonadales bacterium]